MQFFSSIRDTRPHPVPVSRLPFFGMTQRPRQDRADRFERGSNQEIVGCFRISTPSGQHIQAEVTSACTESKLVPGLLNETLRVYKTLSGQRVELLGSASFKVLHGKGYPGFLGMRRHLYITSLKTNHWDYKGIGTQLMLAAFQRSLAYGCEGRIRLYPHVETNENFIEEGFDVPERGTRIHFSPIPFYNRFGFQWCQDGMMALSRLGMRVLEKRVSRQLPLRLPQNAQDILARHR